MDAIKNTIFILLIDVRFTWHRTLIVSVYKRIVLFFLKSLYTFLGRCLMLLSVLCAAPLSCSVSSTPHAK